MWLDLDRGCIKKILGVRLRNIDLIAPPPLTPAPYAMWSYRKLSCRGRAGEFCNLSRNHPGFWVLGSGSRLRERRARDREASDGVFCGLVCGNDRAAITLGCTLRNGAATLFKTEAGTG